MELKIYGSDWDLRIPNYSIVGNLLYNVVAMTTAKELSGFEKHFVVQTSGHADVHAGYLADVYLDCGCFAEARQHFLKPEHPRKLGDICWSEGNLLEAEVFYSKTRSEAQSYRNGADHDRLIKLAFFQGQWETVIERFSQAGFSKGFSTGSVCVGRSETSAQPFLDMLAVALTKLNITPSSQVLAILERSFGIGSNAWDQFLKCPSNGESKKLAKLKSRCRPKACSKKSVTAEQAIQIGDTPRSRHVQKYLQSADESLASAQQALEEFGNTGSETALDAFIAHVTGSGVASMSHTFLFAAFGHDSFPAQNLPPERLVRLFSRHPIMNKRHFGKLLALRFTNNLPVTADDVITGLFQYMGRFAIPFDEEGSFDLIRLASCREWASIRIEEWLNKCGFEQTREVAEIWRKGEGEPMPHPFYPTPVGAPLSVRNMKQWNDLMARALEWLELRWKREIGNSRWIGENQLYQILRRLLKGTQVHQHARPTWLAPQHLDVYVPQAGIAVEYMGRQHFEPLEFFGGEVAFRELVERDRKKALLCRENEVQLIHVHFDEDIGLRAKEIAAQILAIRAK